MGFDEHTNIAKPSLYILCGNIENHSSKNPEETSKPQCDVETRNHILKFHLGKITQQASGKAKAKKPDIREILSQSSVSHPSDTARLRLSPAQRKIWTSNVWVLPTHFPSALKGDMARPSPLKLLRILYILLPHERPCWHQVKMQHCLQTSL